MKLSLPLLLLLLAPAALAAPDKLSDAKSLMADGRYVAASEELTALTEEKEDAAAFAALAECEMKLGDLDAAETAAGRALDIEDEKADYWKLLGRVAFQRGDSAIASGAASNTIKSWFAEAEMKYKQAQKRDPEDPDLTWMIGWAKELQEYPERARALYEEQIAKFPKNPGGYRRLGAQLASDAQNTGDGMTPEAEAIREKALAIFDEGLRQAGPDGEILYFKGLALEWKYAKERDKVPAQQCYADAIRADHELYKAWKRLSEVGYGADRMLELANEILAKDKMSPNAATWAAYYLLQKKKPDEALAIALPTLKKYRENYAVYGQAFAAADAVMKQNTEKGLAAFAKIDEYYPFSGAAANNLGLYHRDVTKNYPESLKWYLRAAEKEPNNQNVVNDAAVIYLFYTKEQRKSLPMFEHVLSLVEDYGQAPDQGYWDTLENLCKYYWEVEHDPEKVIRYAEMRYETTAGVAPYNMSGVARTWAQKAKKELGQ